MLKQGLTKVRCSLHARGLGDSFLQREQQAANPQRRDRPGFGGRMEGDKTGRSCSCSKVAAWGLGEHLG